MPDQAKHRGFTLIELLITVAIIGILASIAYPSYQDYVIRSNRAVTQQFMMDIANRQQAYLMENRSYAGTAAALGLTAGTDVTSYYTVTIAAAAGTPPTFTITSTPVSGSTNASDGNLTLNHLGTKTPSAKW